MKLNMKYKAILLVSAFFLVSCTERETKSGHVISLAKAIAAPVEINASDYEE